MWTEPSPASGRSSDIGGLLDFVFDTIGYAAVPLGLAFGIDDRGTWIATAVLLATFYLNAVSLGYVAALLEKRSLGAVAQGQPTSAVLPRAHRGHRDHRVLHIRARLHRCHGDDLVGDGRRRPRHLDRTGAMGDEDTRVTAATVDSNMNIHRVWVQRGLVLVLWLTVLALWRSHQTSNDFSTAEAGQRFIDAVDAAWWGVFAYIGVYLVRPLVLFPASVLTVMGGLLFGPWLGVVVVVIAANMSAMVAYGVGRLLGAVPESAAPDRADVDPADGDDDLSFVARWSGRLREHSFETVFVMRLLFLPYDLVSYVCGALRIRWAPFLLATALGSLPGTVSFVLLGASLERVDQGLDGINPWAIVASTAIFVVSLVISRLLRKRQP